MVTCTNKEVKYHSELSNGKVTIKCDNPAEYGRQGIEFGPHDFLEAGYAACMNVRIRKICERENIAFESIIVTVALDYHDENKMYMRHKVEIKGVSEEVEKHLVEEGFLNCLVKKNLSKEIVFEPLV